MPMAVIDPVAAPSLVAEDVGAHFIPILTEDPNAVIAVHERKGTAIVRLVDDQAGAQGGLVDRTISTDELIRRGAGADESIVLIDDLLRTGDSVLKVVDDLLAAGVAAERITVAVLGSHIDMDEGRFRERRVALRVWWRELPTRAYARYRTSLVATFQAEWRHYLDTEHLVVGLTFSSARRSRMPSVGNLAEALSRSGDVGILPPAATGARVSSYYPLSERLASSTPQHWGDDETGIVRKVRVLERGLGQYTLLPICLPDVPSHLTRPELDLALLVEQCTDKEHGVGTLEALFTTPAGDARQRFLRVSLVSSLVVLWWALRDLGQVFDGSGEDDVTLNVGVSVSDLAHLSIAHPGLDIDVLARLTRSVAANALARGRDRARSPRTHARPDHIEVVGSDTMHDLVHRLLQRIGSEVEDHAALFDDGLRASVGVEHRRVLALGQELGLTVGATSALLDHIIDRALFSTKVLPVGDRTVRLYQPDGEVTTRALRRERRMGTGRAT